MSSLPERPLLIAYGCRCNEGCVDATTVVRKKEVTFCFVIGWREGGLPGLLLTLAGMGEEGMSVNVRGPSDLKYLVDAMRSFIPNAVWFTQRALGPSPTRMSPLYPVKASFWT